MVLYRYDFILGSDRLRPRGRQRLEKIAKRLAESEHPLVIEYTLDSELDQARQHRVVKELTALGVSEAEERIRVDAPPARGLEGMEAEWAFESMVQPSSGSTAPAGAAPSAPRPAGNAPNTPQPPGR